MTYLLNLLPERLRWLPHNCIAHPLSEILWQLGAKHAADWVHDSTVPEHKSGEGRG